MSAENLIVPDHARIMFANSWTQSAQQKQSRLRGLVTVRTGRTGNSSTIDIDGTAEGEDVTGQRYKEVAINDTASSQRWIYPQEYQLGTHESRWDANTIAPLVAPSGNQAMKHAAAYGRFVDSLLLTQLLGNAVETQTGSTTPSTVALPAGQKVARDYVHTGSAADSDLTVAKLIRALEIIEEAEIWGQDQMESGAKVCMAVNSRAQKALLRSVESGLGAKLMSKDFVPPVIDKNGHISEFLGIHFIRTELITVTSTVAFCPLWVSTEVYLDFWEDMTTSIDKLPQRSNALQFLTQARLGATRKQDEGVVQISCVQA